MQRLIMEKDDVQLIHRILSGDHTAFNTLFQKYQKSIHAIAWQKIGDYHVAEEITQDVFLQAYNKLSTLKEPNKFSRWIYIIAKRRCANWHQREKNTMQSLEATDEAILEKSAYVNYIAEQREKAATEHRREVVDMLLEKLPERERKVITLYYLGEMSSEAISEFLGVSVNTIKSRLRRARQRLQENELIQETPGNIQPPTNIFKQSDSVNMSSQTANNNQNRRSKSVSDKKEISTYPFIVECFEQTKCRGKKVTILHTTENLQTTLDRAGFEDSIASVRIIKGPGCPREGGEVTFFENPKFSGVTLPCDLGPEIIVSEIPNYKAQILSIEINVNPSSQNSDELQHSKQKTQEIGIYPFFVECFEQPRFKGKKACFVQTTENLHESLERSGFEDRISSMRIYKGTDCPPDGGEVVFYEKPNFTGHFLPIQLEPKSLMKEIPEFNKTILSIKMVC